MHDNPFYNQPIMLPKEFEESIKRFVKQAGGDKNIKYAPFLRQVDFWYFCLIYAANKDINPSNSSIPFYQITDGNIFASDTYRIRHIQTIALSYFKDFKLLANHTEVIKLCNNLVAQSCSEVLAIINDKDNGDPMSNLLDLIESSSKSKP